MNPKLRTTLIVIGAVTLIIVAIILVPRGLSIYYQAKGGQQIEYVLRFEEGIDELVCEQLPSSSEEALNEVNGAIGNLNRAVRLNGKNSQAYYYLGKAYCLSGEPEQAKENYSSYTNLRPNNPLGYIGLGFANEELGDEVASTNAWKSAGVSSHDFVSRGKEEFTLEKYENATLWYERAIQLEPGSAEAWLGLGEVNDALQEFEHAKIAYQNAWAINPEISTSALIQSYIRNGDPSLAEELLEQMLAGYPDSQDRILWFQELGSTYLSHGDFDQAFDLYSQAIREFPDQPEYHISLGWAAFERGDGVDAALSEFKKAIEVDPGNAAGYYAVGQLMVRVEEFHEAEHWFMKATELEPENRWYQIVLGNTLRSNGDIDSAIDVYNGVIARNPNYDLAFLEIAWAYYLQNRNEEALVAIENAIEFASNPTEWYFIRAGGIFEQAGEIEEAVKNYYLALGLNPSNETALREINRLEPND